MIITVYDLIIKKYTYFDRIKRLRTSLKLVVDTETVNVTNSTNALKIYVSCIFCKFYEFYMPYTLCEFCKFYEVVF